MNTKKERSITVTMEFLYPTVDQYPFDMVCGQIVRELEKRSWQVPGIKVEFSTYGSGEQKFRMVRSIVGQDFRLRFCRKQRTMPGYRWNDTAAVNELNIPRKELQVYDDESGPTFYLYVGNDWEKDREKFVGRIKVNARYNGEPRSYLVYDGGWPDGYIYRGRRAPLLICKKDHREHSPELDPAQFSTNEVMGEFQQYLERVALKHIMSHPIPREKVDVFAAPAPPAYPSNIGPLFCFVPRNDVSRIRQGRADRNQLVAADRYALHGNSYRLLPLGDKNDGTVPEIAREGFLWCGIGDPGKKTIWSLEIPGRSRSVVMDENYVVRITPNSAGDIYIADNAPYEKRREELFEAARKLGQDRLTDEQVSDFMCARARTIIPISEYRGGYEKPVVLICRELDFDEVEVVSGPWEDRDRPRIQL